MSRSFGSFTVSQLRPWKVGDNFCGKILTPADIAAMYPQPVASAGPYKLPADYAKKARERIDARRRIGRRRITGMSESGNA